MNAEIYYPPYLYDADGNPAARPTLDGTPGALTLSNPAEQQFTATVGAADRVTQVTLLHTGSATHGANLEQTFQKLLFVQDGATLTITSPTNPNYTVPGDYRLQREWRAFRGEDHQNIRLIVEAALAGGGGHADAAPHPHSSNATASHVDGGAESPAARSLAGTGRPKK